MPLNVNVFCRASCVRACACVRSLHLRGQQGPGLSGADLSVHQVSVTDGVGRLAEQHQVGLQVTTEGWEQQREEYLITIINVPSLLYLDQTCLRLVNVSDPSTVVIVARY